MCRSFFNENDETRGKSEKRLVNKEVVFYNVNNLVTFQNEVRKNTGDFLLNSELGIHNILRQELQNNKEEMSQYGKCFFAGKSNRY